MGNKSNKNNKKGKNKVSKKALRNKIIVLCILGVMVGSSLLSTISMLMSL